MNLRDAAKQAEEVKAALIPYCVPGLCHIAGSVRRQKVDMIKDIEIVAVPETRYLRELMDLVNKKWGEPDVGKFPSKYTRIRGLYNLDLFWCTKATFGLNLFIRTGPQSFVVRALSSWKKISEGGYSKDCLLHSGDGKIVETYDEEAVFRALNWNYVRPENRV